MNGRIAGSGIMTVLRAEVGMNDAGGCVGEIGGCVGQAGCSRNWRNESGVGIHTSR